MAFLQFETEESVKVGDHEKIEGCSRRKHERNLEFRLLCIMQRDTLRSNQLMYMEVDKSRCGAVSGD